MTKFEPRNEAGLSKLTDEDLLAYIAAARARGEGDHLQRGLAVIVFRYFDDIVRRCRIKVPPQDAEDVASEAMTSAIRSSLEGQTVGEFRAWLNKIVARRIADYHRKQRVDTAPLPEEHAESDEIWGQAGITDDETGVVEVEDAIARILDKHMWVVHELCRDPDLPLRERQSALHWLLGFDESKRDFAVYDQVAGPGRPVCVRPRRADPRPDTGLPTARVPWLPPLPARRLTRC